MTDLKRKLVALFFTVVFLASVMAVAGCKQSAPTKTPSKTGTKKAPSTGME